MNSHPAMHNALRGVTAAGLTLLLAGSGCAGEPGAPGSPDGGLDDLPEDTGGTHLALPRDPDSPAAAPFGCYLYLPAGLDASPVPYPLLIFLHGAGERGDSAADAATLDAVLRNGPPHLIQRGEWAPPHPMIVVSPQCHNGSWNPDDVRRLLEWVDGRYPVDRSRIYLTGLSMGGYGTWSYLGRFGATAGDSLRVAAAAPICGAGNPGLAAAIATTPVWAFHGTADATVAPSGSVTMVKAVGALSPAVPPRLTLYGGVGHDSWARTYDGSGVGQGLEAYVEDPDVAPWLVRYNPDLYAWLFRHRS